MRDLILVLPIARVNLLTKGPKPMQSQGLPNLSYLVFKAVRETRVEQAVEWTISIVLDLGGESVEVYNIPCNAVSILHPEML